MERRGFSLIETLIALAVAGLVMAIAIPKMRSAMTKQSVRGSRTTLIGLFAQARVIAMQQGRTADLRFNGNQVFITTRPAVIAGNTYDTVVRPRDLGSQFGVTLVPSTNPISIDPRGLTTEGSLSSAKGDYADTVWISQYGRVRK